MGTVQMTEDSGSGIRKWEEMWFKTTAEDGETEREGGSSETGKLCHWQWTDEYVERPETLMRRNVVVVWLQCLLDC